MFKKLPTPIILCLYLFSCSIIPIPFVHNSKKEKEKKDNHKKHKKLHFAWEEQLYIHFHLFKDIIYKTAFKLCHFFSTCKHCDV